MLFRVEGEMVVSEDYFPDDCEDVGKAIDELRKEQSRFPRWYPQTRADLFDFKDFDSFEVTAESSAVEKLLKKICGTSAKYEPDEALFAIYNLLTRGVPPESAYDFLIEQSILPKLEGGRRTELVEAVDNWADVVHVPLLNGNTVKDIRKILASQLKSPKVGRNEPCPCGSGKKFKHCCGMNKDNNVK